ncbi:SgrR family transcriptional regulator [Brevibacillus reuszeri]|uniref:SgrR family transcriptional regulator n=1 Tax=Brevibacillus reuszeri TaxID=54915 RepID=UPI0028A0D03E|nr:ABC transporter substrate-binding protein [Brevibacillus reuszeri]
MKSNQHFMQLLFGLTEWESGKEQTIRIQDLAELLCCTLRNVKLILRKWEKEGLLRWKAGVGRGNHSTLTIMCDIGSFVTDTFHTLLREGKVKEAVELLQHKNVPVQIKLQLQAIWDSQFGFVAERDKNQHLDVLRIPRNRAFSTIDPAFVAVSAESHFIRQICHTLVMYDPATEDFIPQLAHDWESSEDLTVWTFYLRKKVRFHHGRIFTGADVVHTVERLIELDSPFCWQVEDIESMELPNDQTILFHLRKPNGFFLHLIASIGLSILPCDVPFSEQGIIGTGPFRMIEFTESRLVLGAFEEYYRERALLDRVEIWRAPGTTSYAELRYQLTEMEAGTDSVEQSENSKDLEFQEQGCHYLNFNFRKPGIHHDFAFRQAIKQLINPVEMIRDLGKVRFSPAGSFLPERSRMMDFEASSLEEVHGWLKQSAYQGETLTLFYGEGKKCDDEADWFKQRCERIGISLQVMSINKAEFLSDYPDRCADMAMMGEVLQRDVELGLIEIYKNTCTMVYRFLDDERRAIVDQRMTEILGLADRQRRMKALEKMEDMLREELWLTFIYHVKRRDRYHPALQGIAVDSFGWIDFSRLWVKPFVTSL